MAFRHLLAIVLASALWAQQSELPDQIFRATVNVVVVPVTVTDGNGNYVNGLQPQEFRLYDNKKPQDIKVDVTYIPISLVVAIQANADVEGILPKIKKIGPLFQGLVVGEQGEVAIVAFDHRIQVLQDFTSDSDKINEAMEKLSPGSYSSRMVDATISGIRMLSKRPPERRRILLLISETRDKGSEGRTREALTAAQLNNVLIYTVNINRLLSTFTSKPHPPRPDPIPPTARPMPAGVPPTPQSAWETTGGEGTSANFVPLFVEIFRQAKAIFVDNPAEVFTQYTGGREYSFVSQSDLENAITQIGTELHSQYIVTYTPNNKIEGGFHEIKVEIISPTGRLRKDVDVTTRPGYWLAAVPG